ncbi:hypothetical protein KKE34_01965 [Patescibacteria group bacterium]|nr:hypothetical protein [Patescibacteria group bacterium]MBU1885351.1 hypothetical protein [Patescibacteria group bacterium]
MAGWTKVALATLITGVREMNQPVGGGKEGEPKSGGGGAGLVGKIALLQGLDVMSQMNKPLEGGDVEPKSKGSLRQGLSVAGHRTKEELGAYAGVVGGNALLEVIANFQAPLTDVFPKGKPLGERTTGKVVKGAGRGAVAVVKAPFNFIGRKRAAKKTEEQAVAGETAYQANKARMEEQTQTSKNLAEALAQYAIAQATAIQVDQAVDKHNRQKYGNDGLRVDVSSNSAPEEPIEGKFRNK